MADIVKGFDRALSVPFGTTGGTGIRVVTYPDGITTQRADRGQYFTSPFATYQSGSGYAVLANRTYFSPYNVNKDTTIKTLRFMGANTAVTGNSYFSVWTANPDSGNPQTRLYASASTTVGSAYSYTSVTNSSGLVKVPAGNFWIGVTFSSTPTIYAQHKDYILPYIGASEQFSGYRNIMPVIDATGFTAPSSITGTGLTFAFMEYSTATYVLPGFQWQAL